MKTLTDSRITAAERAVHEEHTGCRARLNEPLKSIALQIEQTMAAGQGIVDWQQNEEVLRVIRREIKRNLRRLPGLSEAPLADLALGMVEIARRRLAG